MRVTCCIKLRYLPILMALYLPVAFFITYGMAVAYGHVYPGFPYISDTGTLAPESCVFGQLLNIYAALALYCMIIRYKQVRHFLTQQYKKQDLSLSKYGHLRRTNMVGLVMGVLSALGISIVGNFQETNELTMHVIGAMMAFGIGGLYLWLHWTLSFICRYGVCVGTKPGVLHLRLVCNILNTLCFFCMLIATRVSLDVFDGTTILLWQPHHQGYSPHLVATITEWMMAFCVSVYFGSFYEEFKELKPDLNAKHMTGDDRLCLSPDPPTRSVELA